MHSTLKDWLMVVSWEKMHKEVFKGKMIPFGAKVNFKPSEARKSEAPSKFSPRSSPGIFCRIRIEFRNEMGQKDVSMVIGSDVNYYSCI